MTNTFNLYVYETPTKMASYQDVTLYQRVDCLVAKNSDGNDVFSCRRAANDADVTATYNDSIVFFSDEGMVLIRGINYESTAIDAIYEFLNR